MMMRKAKNRLIMPYLQPKLDTTRRVVLEALLTQAAVQSQVPLTVDCKIMSQRAGLQECRAMKIRCWWTHRSSFHPLKIRTDANHSICLAYLAFRWSTWNRILCICASRRIAVVCIRKIGQPELVDKNALAIIIPSFPIWPQHGTHSNEWSDCC